MTFQFQQEELIETWWSSTEHDSKLVFPPLPGKIRWVMSGEQKIIAEGSNGLGEFISVWGETSDSLNWHCTVKDPRSRWQWLMTI